MGVTCEWSQTSPRSQVVFLFLVLLVPVAAEAGQEHGGVGSKRVDHQQDIFNTSGELVKELDGVEFEKAKANFAHLTVEFYAPWCKHCSELAPQLNFAALLMKRQNLSMELRKVNADYHKGIAFKYGVQEYPTFAYFRDGKHKTQFLPKKMKLAENMVAKFKSLMFDEEKEPPLSTFEAAQTDLIKDFIQRTKDTEFTLLLRAYKLSAKAQAYKKAVKESIERYTASKIRCAFVNVSKTENTVLTMYRPGFKHPEAQEIVYNGKWQALAIGRWAKMSTYPVVDKVFSFAKHGWSAIHELFLDASVIAVLPTAAEEVVEGACKADAPSQCGDEAALTEGLQLQVSSEATEAHDIEMLTHRIVEEFQVLSSQYPQWRFAVVSADHVTAHELEKLGWSPEHDVTVTVLKEKRKKYLLQGRPALEDRQTLRDFLSNVSLGQQRPSWKSEPTVEGEAPEVEDGLVVLKGNTFPQHAFDPSLDVLVYFHAPWCVACNETVLPVLSNLAERIEEQGWKFDGVMLAKMDASRNECEEETSEFPKIVLYPAVQADRKMQERRVYPGTFDLDRFTEFLVKHSKNIKLTHWLDKPKPKQRKRKAKPPPVVKKAEVKEARRRRTYDD